MGLVEFGVGLIPGGGGTKLLNASLKSFILEILKSIGSEIDSTVGQALKCLYRHMKHLITVILEKELTKLLYHEHIILQELVPLV